MTMSEQSELFQSAPAHFIEREIKKFVLNDPVNRLAFMNDYLIWDEPLVAFADGDDLIFTEYKAIIATVHLTPREALAEAYNISQEDLPSSISVVSWILPITEETRKSNRTQTTVPSRLWSHTRWYGEQSNEKLREHVVKLLTDRGYLAVAPMSQDYFKMLYDEKGPYSNWSERHIAYAAGLGTFSLSDGFITESGVAHRCGSVVTNLVLPPSPRTAENHYSNCLFYAGISCKSCISRCPAGAITDEGHDKTKCQQHLRDIRYLEVVAKGGYDNDTSVAGCGLCQTDVPCEFYNPVTKMKEAQERRNENSE